MDFAYFVNGVNSLVVVQWRYYVSIVTHSEERGEGALFFGTGKSYSIGAAAP